MRLIRADIPSNCDIANISDTHDGNIGCAHSAIASVVDWCLSAKNRFITHGGDWIDAITTDDKRYKATSRKDSRLSEQADHIADVFHPARKRIKAGLSGNHEESTERVINFAQEYIATKLGIPYGGRTCKVAFYDTHGLMFKMFLAHPSRITITSNAKDYEQQLANMKARLRLILLAKACDCVVMGMGHTHKLLVSPPSPKLIIRDDGTRLIQDYLHAVDQAAEYIEPDCRWFINTGSFLRTQILDEDGYGEAALYDPVEIGYTIMEVRDRRVVNIRKVVC